MQWKPRYSASEPLVVWKNEEPRMLRDALRAGMLEELRTNYFGGHDQDRAPGDSVLCSQLGNSWFKPVTNPYAERGADAQGLPVACEWTPGEPEVVIINR
jgi:hypothetical protein